jgi:hypothetical protein
VLPKIPHVISSGADLPVGASEEPVSVVAADRPTVHAVQVYHKLIEGGKPKVLFVVEWEASAKEVSGSIRHPLGVFDPPLLLTYSVLPGYLPKVVLVEQLLPESLIIAIGSVIV